MGQELTAGGRSQKGGRRWVHRSCYSGLLVVGILLRELGAGQLTYTRPGQSPGLSQLQVFECQGLRWALRCVGEAPGENGVSDWFPRSGLAADNWVWELHPASDNGIYSKHQIKTEPCQERGGGWDRRGRNGEVEARRPADAG